MTQTTEFALETPSAFDMEAKNRSELELSGQYFEINASEVSKLNENYARNLLPVSLIWGALAIIGIIGNCAVLLVYGLGRHARNKSYRPLILFLAAVDLFTCVVLVPVEIAKYRFYFSTRKTSVCRVKCAFNMFALISTTFLLLVIAWDRYSAVSDPMKKFKKGALTRKSSFIKCFILLMTSILMSVPAAILCGSSHVTVNEINAFTCGADQQWKTSSFRYVYKYTLSVLQVAISLILIVLYCRIGCIIKQSLRKRSSRLSSVTVSFDGETNKLENSVHIPLPSNIKALFVVTITFIVTFFLFAVLSFFSISRFSDSYPAYVFFMRVYFIQSVATPLMYAKMDKKFRHATLTLFCRKRQRKSSSSSMNSV